MAVIGSRPGDDVSKTAERNLHGGTKVWSALHTEIPGPMKCCSLRIGLPNVVQENRAGLFSVTRHWPSKIMRCGDCTTAALANRNGSIGLLRGFARNVRTREGENFPQAFSDVALIRTALNLRDFSPA
jgi:hypothetical protein